LNVDTIAIYHGNTLEAADLTFPLGRSSRGPYINVITLKYAYFSSFTTEPRPNLADLITI